MSNPNPYPPGRNVFSSTNQPKNRGRKPSVLKKYIRDNGVTAEDMMHAFRYVAGLDRDKLQEIVKDPKQPAIIVVAASAMLGDIMKKKLDNTSTVMRKAHIDPEKMLQDSSGSDSYSPGSSGAGDQNQFHTYEFPSPDEIE